MWICVWFAGLLIDRNGTLMKSGILVAFGLAACSSSKQGSSSTGGSGAPGSNSSSGGVTGASTTGGSGQGSTSGSSGSGSSTGGFDQGCSIGVDGGKPVGSVCLFPFDCGCGLLCAQDISGGSANLICQVPCVSNSDCPLFNERCQMDAGLCLGGLYGSCSGSADLEFAACTSRNGDCPCPFECYPDPVLGAACEHPCNS